MHSTYTLAMARSTGLPDAAIRPKRKPKNSASSSAAAAVRRVFPKPVRNVAR